MSARIEQHTKETELEEQESAVNAGEANSVAEHQSSAVPVIEEIMGFQESAASPPAVPPMEASSLLMALKSAVPLTMVMNTNSHCEMNQTMIAKFR